jgi:hypothetical protein
VEPACGCALSLAYDPLLLKHCLSLSPAPPSINNSSSLSSFRQTFTQKDLPNVIVVVCGGSGASISAIRGWEAKFGLAFSPESDSPELDLGKVDMIVKGKRSPVTFFDTAM